MFIGIDLGTSAVKAVLLDRDNAIRAVASAALSMLPQTPDTPLWREQDPAAWWAACEQAVQALLALAVRDGIAPGAIEAIGLTGQMHGATVLDAAGQVLRPAMLWNDGRAFEECAELERRVPDSRRIGGNLMMPGFTAPKLLWLARHEPELFARIATVLLPKDWLRYRLTGALASDMSDAAGTLWLDVARRDWSDELLAATGLSRAQMPALFEGPDICGHLDAALARRWGLRPVPVVAGAGDNAAGAIGVGIVRPGQAMLSLGTSGVYFVASDGFHANTDRAVHSFCHALPQTWHQMSVMLSAASCLDFCAQLTAYADVAALLADAEANDAGAPAERAPLFLPYLSGERTPYNDPAAQAVYFGLSAATQRHELARATLEGVGFGLCDGIDAVDACAPPARDILLIGGGSRSAYWAQMLADISGRVLTRCRDGDAGPALGAARLAWLGVERRDGEALAVDTICPAPAALAIYRPDARRHARYARRRETFKVLYRQLQPVFRG
jgi:xylulokinase